MSLFDRESDKQAISLFLNWFKQLAEHGRVDKDDYKSLEKIYLTKEEVRAMLITALEKEKKETFERGIEKGQLREKIVIAKNMLSEGMSISFISKMTGLSEDLILKSSSELR